MVTLTGADRLVRLLVVSDYLIAAILHLLREHLHPCSGKALVDKLWFLVLEVRIDEFIVVFLTGQTVHQQLLLDYFELLLLLFEGLLVHWVVIFLLLEGGGFLSSQTVTVWVVWVRVGLLIL